MAVRERWREWKVKRRRERKQRKRVVGALRRMVWLKRGVKEVKGEEISKESDGEEGDFLTGGTDHWLI